MEVVEWFVWGLACAWISIGFFTFLSNPRRVVYPWYQDPILKTAVGGAYIASMLAALLITFIWDVSKLHLLWSVPLFTVLSKVVPTWIYMGVRKLVCDSSSTTKKDGDLS